MIEELQRLRLNCGIYPILYILYMHSQLDHFTDIHGCGAQNMFLSDWSVHSSEARLIPQHHRLATGMTIACWTSLDHIKTHWLYALQRGYGTGKHEDTADVWAVRSRIYWTVDNGCSVEEFKSEQNNKLCGMYFLFFKSMLVWVVKQLKGMVDASYHIRWKADLRVQKNKF